MYSIRFIGTKYASDLFDNDFDAIGGQLDFQWWVKKICIYFNIKPCHSLSLFPFCSKVFLYILQS